MQASEEELRNHVNPRVADYKRIRGPILFQDSLPKNSMGKLLRSDGKTWAVNLLKLQEKEKNDDF